MKITEDQFDDLKPISNPHGDHGWNGTMWETHGAELNFVRNQPKERVWTLIDGEEGPTVISGFHPVDAIGHFVTELPWTEETEVEV